MGDRVNGPVTNLFAGAGCLLLLAISYYMVTTKIPQTIGPKSTLVDQAHDSTDSSTPSKTDQETENQDG